MLTKYVVVLFVFIIGQSYKVRCRTCTETVVTSVVEDEMYFMHVMETYQERCFFRRTCQKTRYSYRTATRPVVKTKREVKYVCCDGYENISNDDENLQCRPVCRPSCKHGVCESPGACACLPGYIIISAFECAPVCTPPCGAGSCDAINSCSCFFGHSLQNGTCLPVCLDPCVNGVCTAPDVCTCLDGYSKIDNSVCQPQCTNCTGGTCISPGVCVCAPGWEKADDGCNPQCGDCGHGVCTAPNQCSCDFGYALQNDTCQPVCTKSCENAACVAPETCECWSGYRDMGHGCFPFCSDGCSNGTCVGPEQCVCNKGWQRVDGQCVSLCATDCGNGTCVDKDVCKCDGGFTFENNTCVPVCDKPCANGTCVAPNVCACWPGYARDPASDDCAPQCSSCGISDCLAPEVCRLTCANSCGNGTCVGNDTCVCHEGYFQTHVGEECQPKCEDCEGICHSPNLCSCESPYQTKKTIKDNCSSFVDECEKTICVLETSTSGERVSFGDDVLDYYNNYEYENVDGHEEGSGRPDSRDEKLGGQQKSSSTLYWICGTCGCLVLLAVLAVVVIKRKRLSTLLRAREREANHDECSSL